MVNSTSLRGGTTKQSGKTIKNEKLMDEKKQIITDDKKSR
jgi:hypothetical protein